MVRHELRVAGNPLTGEASIWQEHRLTGTSERGLPPIARVIGPRIDAWGRSLLGNYSWEDRVDLALGWSSEEARLEFLEESRRIDRDLASLVGGAWSVAVSPEPAVTVVRLMGEYSSEWPLWIWEGGTGSEDWPMLSEQLHQRLKAWAIEAEPDLRNRNSGPEPQVTEQLARDLRRELGPRFILKVLDRSRP
jgi:hypothetical protein